MLSAFDGPDNRSKARASIRQILEALCSPVDIEFFSVSTVVGSFLNALIILFFIIKNIAQFFSPVFIGENVIFLVYVF